MSSRRAASSAVWGRVALGLLVFVPAAGVLWLHARSYLPFMADDAFIALRYSRRLLDGHGLTWTDGPAVEGYSSLLWVLLCAAVGSAFDLVQSARAVGMLCTLALLGTVAWWSSASRWRAPAGLGAALALALSSPIAVWAIGGLEQSLVVALLGFAVVSLWGADPRARAGFVPAGAALAALVLSRPDSPLFVAALGVAVLVQHGWGVLRIAWPALVGLPLFAWLAQLAFRLVVYGDWVPNPARLKIAFTAQRLPFGWDYVASGWAVLLPTLLFGAVGMIALASEPRRRRAAALVLLPWLAWLGYVVAIGGDIFPARRHLVPLLALGALGGLLGLGSAAETDPRWRSISVVVAGTAVVLTALWSPRDQRARDARAEQWEWAGEVTGRFLATAFAAARPTVAVDSAGCVPYFSGLPAIDMLGLNDAHISRHLPAGFGTGSVSHDLHDVGDADYVLGREPELILPCGPLGSAAACSSVAGSGRLFAHPRFLAEYQPMRFRGELPFVVIGTVWVRRDSRIAQVSTPEGTWLGAALMAGGAAVARLDDRGLYAEIPPRGRVVLGGLRPGSVVVAVNADSAVEGVLDGSGTLLLNNRWPHPVRLRHVLVR